MAVRVEMDEEDLVDSYRRGRSLGELSRRYGVHERTIRTRLAANGVRFKSETLPAEPFRRVLLRDLEIVAALYLASDGGRRGFNELQARSGVDCSTLSSIANGVRDTVSLDTVDAYCCRMGHLLQDLYPSLYAFEGSG